MFFKNYRYFLTIADQGGLSKAAESLYLSQPSLSKYVSRLETELGVELFDHSTSPLQLTHAGKRYYAYAKRLLSLEQQFENELSSLRAHESGVIRIGIAQWRGSILLPSLIPAFQKVYPHYHIEVLEGRAKQIEAALIQGKVDICLMNLPSHFPNQTVRRILWNERLLLVGNKNHPVVQQALSQLPVQPDGYRHIDIQFLENEHFISLKPGQNAAIATQQLFEAHNLTPKSTWETENISTALNMVSLNQGFTMMPEAGARIAKLPDNLAFFTVSHAVQMFSFAAVYRKDFVPGKPINTLLELAQEIYNNA